MSNLTLTQFAADDSVLSVTEHDTLTEALREYDGWQKAGSVRYMVQGSMTVDCVCKRTMESRNRDIELYVVLPCNKPDAENGNYIAVKAPQACKYLQTVLAPCGEDTTVNVTITNNLFRIG